MLYKNSVFPPYMQEVNPITDNNKYWNGVVEVDIH